MLYLWILHIVGPSKWAIYIVCCFPFFSLFLHLSSPLKEEPSDVREEEPHLRLRHGIYHQRHAHRSQSDAEERHGVAVLTVMRGTSQPACACQWVRSISLSIGKRTTRKNTQNSHWPNLFFEMILFLLFCFFFLFSFLFGRSNTSPPNI